MQCNTLIWSIFPIVWSIMYLCNLNRCSDQIWYQGGKISRCRNVPVQKDFMEHGNVLLYTQVWKGELLTPKKGIIDISDSLVSHGSAVSQLYVFQFCYSHLTKEQIQEYGCPRGADGSKVHFVINYMYITFPPLGLDLISYKCTRFNHVLISICNLIYDNYMRDKRKYNIKH